MAPSRQQLRRQRLATAGTAGAAAQPTVPLGFAVTVDELVVSGFNHRVSARLVRAFENELCRRLQDASSTPRVAQRFETMDGRTVSVRAQDTPEVVARRAAQSVVERIES